MKRKSFCAVIFALISVFAVIFSSCESVVEKNPSGIVDESDLDNKSTGAPAVIDFDGYNYRMLGHGFDETAGLPISIVSDELNTDVINNAQYRRNEKVKQMYNIQISAEVRGDAYLAAKQYAGEDIADVFFVSDRIHYGNTVDYALNLLDIPTLRMGNDYWDQDHNKAVTVNGVLQTGVGNIFGSEEMHMSAIVMNNKLYTDIGHDVDKFHEDVLNGKWYYSDFFDYIKDGTRDIDGIPGMTSSDQFGLLCSWDIYWQLYNSTGLDVISQDSDGDYFFTITSDETLSAFNIFKDVCTSPEITSFGDPLGMDSSVNYRGFAKGHGLFCLIKIGRMELLRSMEDEYTILPIPKIYETSDRYYSVADGFSTVLWIPKTVKSVERTGLITEALAYYSDEYQSALYEKVLMEKYARDPISQKLLQTVFTNVHWQMDEQMLIGDFRQGVCHIWAKERKGISAFGSTTKNFVTVATDKLNEVVTMLEESKNNSIIN